MTAIMTCKLNGLFDVGEDFDDEDLLEVDWSALPVSGPATLSSNYVPSNVLRGTAALHNDPATTCQLPTEGLTSALHRTVQKVLVPERSAQNTIGQAVASGLRRLSASVPQRSSSPPRGQSGVPHLTSAQPRRQDHPDVAGKQEAPLPQDDFDDWDLDLADLDACDARTGPGALVGQMATAPASASASRDGTVSPAKRLRPSGCGGGQTVSSRGPRGFNPSHQSGLAGSNSLLCPSIPTPFLSPGPRPAFVSAPPPSPGVFPGFAAPSPRASPRPATPRDPPRLQRPWTTPGPHAGRCPFDSSSSSSARSPSPCPAPRPLHTPVLTNHLVQLVSNSNRTPGTPRSSDPTRPRTRRFPGPAGLLPRQPHGQSLDDIVVAIPQTPAHGAVARLPSQVPSSQSEEEDFSGGPWAVMKAEMGLDERNTSCFLHSYSVAMVLRKAALKQLAKNKVPNMAVFLKSILHTHADARAVFRDHTGEMQGTVHRRLLEDRLGELKTGAVLLLKQVGVFSPSHRNHYLNVTPNNLLRIYPPGGAAPAASHLLPPPHLEPLKTSPVPGAPVSQMELHFDDDEEEEEEGQAPDVPVVSKTVTRMLPQGPAGTDQAWDADDDLDELLGELPVESYSL